ncbi:hypothetical protein HDU86_000676 [Geranomyces michiganensis]|nr:hypothetical protein HDU86_000676 [Geranomyces michiganensis]
MSDYENDPLLYSITHPTRSYLHQQAHHHHQQPQHGVPDPRNRHHHHHHHHGHHHDSYLGGTGTLNDCHTPSVALAADMHHHHSHVHHDSSQQQQEHDQQQHHHHHPLQQQQQQQQQQQHHHQHGHPHHQPHLHKFENLKFEVYPGGELDRLSDELDLSGHAGGPPLSPTSEHVLAAAEAAMASATAAAAEQLPPAKKARKAPVNKRKRQGTVNDGQRDASIRKLRDLEAVIKEHLGTGKFFLVAAALREIDEEKLYIPAKSVYESLVEDASLPVPVNISHIRSLHKFPADVRRFIWKMVCKSGQTITEEHVVAMTVKHETGISFSNLNNELYTPKPIISAGKVVIGRPCFDLDPASCEFANDKVHDERIATTFYDETADGLQQPWHGDVWLSPPLGQDAEGNSQQSRWFCAAEEKYRAGEVHSVMVLLKVDFGTAWFCRAQNYPHCFFGTKLSFSTPTGREKSMQDESHVLVYM